MTNITEPGRIPESRKQFHAPSALAIDIGGTKTAFAWMGADGGHHRFVPGSHTRAGNGAR